MKSESGISNRWKLFEDVTGIADLKHKFNAYGWYKDEYIRISKDEHWCGWWNDCFNFVGVFPVCVHGRTIIKKLGDTFSGHGYSVSSIINGGISISYQTMTPQESHEKAKRNLLNGGRMSD